MSDAPKQWLDDAREAVKTENFSVALEKYEYFFDHALEEERSYYGVRLSYCLNEWASLGKKYQPARERLIAKKENTRELLLKTKNDELFHDFEAICKYLGQEEESMQLFLLLHKTERKLAEAVVRYIWDRLVSSKNWEICSIYLGDPESRYENLLLIYDKTMEIHHSDPDKDLVNYTEERFVQNAVNLLRALTNTNQSSAAEEIVMRIATDTRERGCEHLKNKVAEQVGL